LYLKFNTETDLVSCLPVIEFRLILACKIEIFDLTSFSPMICLVNNIIIGSRVVFCSLGESFLFFFLMFEKQSEADSKKDDVRARKSENLLIRNEKLLEIAY